ncbi:MAG: GTP-binding protein, partial [bacterium]|nr:GTP-binding protein [bacterium]
LFNALLSDDRAIVDSSAGTTRDVISEAIIIDGLKFILHDTAGVRATNEGVEQKGIKRTHKTVADADIVLLLKSQDTEPVEVNTSSPTIVVGTKNDIASVECEIKTSSLEKSGIKKLKSEMLLVARRDDVEKMLRMGLFLNERHRHKLQSSQASLSDLKTQILDNKIGDDIVATLLASTLTELGEISGRVYTETLLEDVFSKFCVGK